MFDIHAKDEDYFPTNMKEVGVSRIQLDKWDVQRTVDQHNSFGIFQHENPIIVSLGTT